MCESRMRVAGPPPERVNPPQQQRKAPQTARGFNYVEGGRRRVSAVSAKGDSVML
jgi:hypothetical protein